LLVNKKAIHIEWGDCDPLGIVYYPRYFEFFDACTDDLFEKAGLPMTKLLETYGIAGIPMVETRAVFTASSAFGDNVTIESCVARWGITSFSVEHKLFKDNILAVECFEKRVWVVRSPDPAKRIVSRPIPKEVSDKFS
jgi:4-hydroxybenzoyl-CoA thioesterase